MPKQNSSLLKTVLKWAAVLFVFLGVPAFINFFSQPKYGVFDGITIFTGKYKAAIALILFAAVYALRVFLKKQKPEVIKGAAVFFITGLAAFFVLKLFRMHAFGLLYLTGLLMSVAYYFLEEIPGLSGRIKEFVTGTSEKYGHILKWVWRVFLFVFGPVLLISMGKYNYQLSDFFSDNIAGIAILFFSVPAVWRAVVKKQKFSFLLSAGIFILAGLAALLLKGLISKIPFVDSRIYNYYSALMAAYLSMRDAAVLSFLQKTIEKIKSKLGPKIKGFLKSAAEFLGKYSKKSANKIMEVKDKRVKALIAVLVIAAAIGVFKLAGYIYEQSFVSVIALTPKGEVGENTVIIAEFSKPVELAVKDVSELKCFAIKPEIKGKYSFENAKTVMFTPDEPLLPSTDYEVVMTTAGYFSAPRKKVLGSPKTQFHTPYMNIVDQRFFANKDILKNEEKEVVGEINFNYPVSVQDLEKAVEVKKVVNPNCNSMTKKESPMKFKIEASESPLRYYIRIPDISRTYDCQEIKVKIASGLKCPACTTGMPADFEQSVSISQKQYLAVESVSPWQEEGQTLIAIRFNMPVSGEQVKDATELIRNATVNKPAEGVPFTIKTEYCYAVLSGAFEPNLQYSVNIAKGIMSKTGDPMKESYGSSVTIEDLPSSLEYAEEGEILAPGGDMNVALRVMNLDRINVRLYKIFRNNIVHYLRYHNTNEYGQMVYNSNYDIKGGKINQEITEYINFTKFSGEPYKGIFVAEISDPKNYWQEKTKIVRCTNLGMIAKTSGKDLHVKVMSVGSLAPLQGITIKLMSTTNQIMKEAKTDEAGKAVFKNWRDAVYNFTPYLILAENDDDFSYLLFDGSMLDNYRFETGGEPNNPPEGMTAFVASDRGLYRPGENVNLTAVLRDNGMGIPPGIIIENRITGPQGEVVQSEKKTINSQGMETFALKLGLAAMTGEYRSEIRVLNDRVIGSVTFKVEEFIPDKLVVKINSAEAEVKPGSPLLFDVQANQMFGPPAAGNKSETEVKFRDYTFQSKKFKDYVFRDPLKTFSEKLERLGTEDLDATGKFHFDVAVPSSANPPSALLAEIYSEVFDDGGRPVGAYKTLPVHVYKYYLGLKLKDPRKIYKRGDKVELDIAAINPADEPQKVKNVEVIVKRKVWYSIFRATKWSRQSYDSSYYEEAILYKNIDINGQATLSFDADVEGEYYIYVGNEERMRTGLSINVSGPGFTTYDMSKAEKITIATDKDKYRPGDTATVSIKAPFDGMVYVTLDRDKVFYERYVQVVNGSAIIEIPVQEEYLPNVYINAVAVRKPDEKYLSLPFAAYGVQNLTVDKAAKDLNPKISCKDEVMSNEGISAEISGLPAGTAAVLAAVDEGILQIIKFETPDPLSYFYRKKMMETSTYTIFNKVLTDIKAKKAAIGGDYGADGMAKHLNPIVARNESYAKFSGIVYADENGVIKYRFGTEKFNGKVRVMIFTVKGDRFGSDDRKVNVVDPIVITPILPRFLAPGDEFFMPVRVYNNTAKDAEFEIKAEVDGPAGFEKAVLSGQFIKSKQEIKLTFRGRAKDEAGKAVFKVIAAGAGETMSVERELSVRPAAHLETKVYRGFLEGGKELKLDLPANYITQGKKTRLFMSYSRAAEYAGAFDYLIHYPYGCIEQTTSSGFPLIYFKDLGVVKMLLDYQGINTDTYINETIKRLRSFVLPGNRLTFWPGSSGDASDFTKLYVSHFLIEAKRKGYFVPEDLYNSVLASAGLIAGQKINIKVAATPVPEYDEEGGGDYEGDGEGGGGYEGENEASPPQDTEQEPEARLDRRSVNQEAYNFENNIYKLYLKTLLGNPDANTMKYYEDLFTLYVKKNLKNEKILKDLGYSADKIRNMSASLEKEYMLKANLIDRTAADFANGLSETDRYMLSLSYSEFNNQEAARMIVYDDFKSKYMVRELNGFFNSYSRNLGMYLAALSQAEGKANSRIDYNEELLLKEIKENGSFGSTQETAWSLIGLSAAAKARGKGAPINADIFINGELKKNTAGEESVILSDRDNSWKNVKLSAKESGAKVYYNVYVEGTPKEKNKKSLSKGLKIYRKYYNEDGGEANLTSVTQGKLIVVSVTLEPQGGRTLDNVVVVDMLPAGFEIENPRLKTRGSLKFDPVSNFEAVYEDIRDDRMLMFTGEFASNMTFSYTVRAVSPGKFIIPNAYAEAMYDPDVKAESYEGDYLVVAPNKF